MAFPNGYIDNDRWFHLTAGFISARTVPAHIRPLAGWRDHQVWGSYVPIVCPVCGFPNLEAHQVLIDEMVRVLIWTSCDFVLIDGVWQRFYNDPIIVLCAIHNECAGVYRRTAVLGG